MSLKILILALTFSAILVDTKSLHESSKNVNVKDQQNGNRKPKTTFYEFVQDTSVKKPLNHTQNNEDKNPSEPDVDEDSADDQYKVILKAVGVVPGARSGRSLKRMRSSESITTNEPNVSRFWEVLGTDRYTTEEEFPRIRKSTETSVLISSTLSSVVSGSTKESIPISSFTESSLKKDLIESSTTNNTTKMPQNNEDTTRKPLINLNLNENQEIKKPIELFYEYFLLENFTVTPSLTSTKNYDKTTKSSIVAEEHDDLDEMSSSVENLTTEKQSEGFWDFTNFEFEEDSRKRPGAPVADKMEIMDFSPNLPEENFSIFDTDKISEENIANLS